MLNLHESDWTLLKPLLYGRVVLDRLVNLRDATGLLPRRGRQVHDCLIGLDALDPGNKYKHDRIRTGEGVEF